MVARANHRVTYPSRIQLIAAMNPCRCGSAGEPGQTCRRGPRCAADYQARISGPLLDRIDIRIEVPARFRHRPDPARRERIERRRGACGSRPRGRSRRSVMPALGAPKSPLQRAGRRRPHRDGRRARARRNAAPGGRGGGHAALRARLSSRAEACAHACRSRRRRDGRAHPHRRGAELPRAAGRAARWRPDRAIGLASVAACRDDRGATRACNAVQARILLRWRHKADVGSTASCGCCAERHGAGRAC